jgi:hypothetical protein
MCLSVKEKFTPAKEGYQVKLKPLMSTDGYQSIYFHVRGGMRIGETHKAKRRRTSGGYMSGFHVFHSLKDAKGYQSSAHCARVTTVIVKVKTGGSKITGIQKFWSNCSPRRTPKSRYIRAKVTVCSKMTILYEIPK